MAALRTVRAHGPACLLVIGELRASERVYLTHFATEHPQDAARVIVTGRLDEPAVVAQHLRLCDVFLHPSLWDGMPNAV